MVEHEGAQADHVVPQEVAGLFVDRFEVGRAGTTISSLSVSRASKVLIVLPPFWLEGGTVLDAGRNSVP